MPSDRQEEPLLETAQAQPLSAGVATRRKTLAGDSGDNSSNDEAVEEASGAPAPNLWLDSSNFLLLCVLYLLQGVPIGLTLGSLPFLLKERLSYSDMALFSLSSYPYSLKLLWSPFVDSVYVRSIGRRRSWIIPMQLIIGLCLLHLGGSMEALMGAATLPEDSDADSIPVVRLAAMFFGLVFLCATQDIAVDGWALTLLRKQNVEYASTAQTVGLNTGYFLSFTVFLALNSRDFCNKYLFSEPQEHGLVSLGGYLRFWGAAYILVTAYLVFFKREAGSESPAAASGNVRAAYRTILSILAAPSMRTFIVVLLLAKVAFVANEAVSGLKLLEYGFNKEDLALTVLLDFPFQLIAGYYAARWSAGDRPLKPWRAAFVGRLVCAILGMLVVWAYPPAGAGSLPYFATVTLVTVANSFMSTIQFVGMGCFFARISDPVIGGTYMTLLNTLSNVGGTWPRYPVLKLVDFLTVSQCVVPAADLSVNATAGFAARRLWRRVTSVVAAAPVLSSVADSGLSGGDSAGDSFGLACATAAEKEHCVNVLHGTCQTDVDGYYVVNTFCVVIGAYLMLRLLFPRVRQLEALPVSAWRLKRDA